MPDAAPDPLPVRVPRVLILVCDSFGVGDAPDAEAYGDTGSDTLGNTARAVGGIDAPNLGALGLGLLTEIEGVPPNASEGTAHGRLTERSAGKDTTTGHWEIAGIVLDTPFPLYPDGFPRDVVEPFEERIGRRDPRERAGVRDRDRRAARRGASGLRSADRVHERRFCLPDRDPHRRRSARAAVRMVSRRARPAGRRAPGRSRDRAAVRRRAGRVPPPTRTP